MGYELGTNLIADERARQMKKFSEEHDDGYQDSELALAAIVYADPNVYDSLEWMWPGNWKEPKYAQAVEVDGVVTAQAYREARIKNLAKAGALIAAEIDRLQRIDEE